MVVKVWGFVVLASVKTLGCDVTLGAVWKQRKRERRGKGLGLGLGKELNRCLLLLMYTKISHYFGSIHKLSHTTRGKGCPCVQLIVYTMSQFKFKLIIPLNSEFIILSLAWIWTQNPPVASRTANHWAMTTWSQVLTLSYYNCQTKFYSFLTFKCWILCSNTFFVVWFLSI